MFAFLNYISIQLLVLFGTHTVTFLLTLLHGPPQSSPSYKYSDLLTRYAALPTNLPVCSLSLHLSVLL